MEKRLGFTEIDPKLLSRITSLGGKPLHLYKILAHHPQLLSAWIEFAYSLRKDCETPRALRELMILRGAQICHSDYEWQQHLKMAEQAGISAEKINQLSQWNQSVVFTEIEKTALELMEALLQGQVSDELFKKCSGFFSSSEYLELVLTGSFYAMVPRVLNALEVPLEILNSGS